MKEKIKKIALIFVFVALLFGAEPATKDDIQMILKMMEVNQDAVNKRFDAVDKRFESVDKRFESMQHQMDKRFEQVNSHLELIGNIMLALVAGIFGLIGFMMWDRRTVVEKAKKETEMGVEKIIEMRLEKKADKALLDKILEIIERLAKDDKETQELLKKTQNELRLNRGNSLLYHHKDTLGQTTKNSFDV